MKHSVIPHGVLIFLAGLTLVLLLISPSPRAQTQGNPEISRQAFLGSFNVLTHPRCMNCHPAGDNPLVGDKSRPHPMDIRRGPNGMGEAGLSCSACHQDKNQPGEHTPPGAPDWHLPTKSMPMIFQNKTPRQICEQLKDPSRNGGRTPDQIVEHVREAPLVIWGWSPGKERTVPPIPHSDFVRIMDEWAKNGAYCPE